MRDIRDCSGPWRGTWVQRTVRGTMNFTLKFLGDGIDGGGADLSGKFSMAGTYDPASNEVVLVKRYWHCKVKYDGTWNGSFVAGTSIIGPAWLGERGSFEMWPEDEEQAVEEALQDQDEPAVIPEPVVVSGHI